MCAGIAARETAQALKTLAQAARGVAASTTDPKAAAAMLDSARNVMEGSALLIHEAKQALISPGDAESQQRLAQVRPSGSDRHSSAFIPWNVPEAFYRLSKQMCARNFIGCKKTYRLFNLSLLSD